jgi:hypothetical protein
MPIHRIPADITRLEALTTQIESEGGQVVSWQEWAGEFIVHSAKSAHKTTKTPASARETRKKP